MYSVAIETGRAPLPVEHAGERFALEQFHDDVGVALGRAVDVGHLHDVWRCESAQLRVLLEETFYEARAFCEIRVKNLDGYPCAQNRVLALVDRPHAPIAQEAHEAVLSVDNASDPEHVLRPA